MKYFALIMIGLVGLAYWRIDYLTRQNATLKAERDVCLNQREEDKNAQISSSKLIKELRSSKAQPTSVVDCDNVALPEYVVRVFDKLK